MGRRRAGLLEVRRETLDRALPRMPAAEAGLERTTLPSLRARRGAGRAARPRRSRCCAALAPLLGQLERHQKPLSAIAWLERSPAAPTFHAMLRGEIAISHDTLDQHDVGQATAYLRSWLVAHHVLAPREELLARYERWAQRALQALADHPDRAHVAAYARWKIGSDYARKLRTGQARPSSNRGYYANLRAAISFTRWLHDNDLTLEQTRQAHVDQWLNGPPSRALPTRAFLTWANTTGLIPALHVPRPAPRTTNTPIDHATRLTQARGLLDNSDTEPAASPERCCCSTASSSPASSGSAAKMSTSTTARSGYSSAEIPSRYPNSSLRCSATNRSTRPAHGCSQARNQARTSDPSASAADSANSGSAHAQPDPARSSPSPSQSPPRSSPNSSATTTTPPTTGAVPPQETGPATPASPADPPPEPAPVHSKPTGPPSRRPRSDHRRSASRYARGSATTVASPPSPFSSREHRQGQRSPPHHGGARAFRRFEYTTSARG